MNEARDAELLGALLRRRLETTETATDRAGKERLLRAARQPAKPQRDGALRLAGAVALAAAVALMVSWLGREPAGPADDRALQGRFISAGAGKVERVRFDDSSELVLGAGGRLRISEARPEHVALALETGQLSMNVAHTGKRRWSVRAGPYTVAVIGTRFDVAWDSTREVFDLELREGVVQIESAEHGVSMKLERGQRFRGEPRLGRHGIENQVAPDASVAAPAASPSGPAAPASAAPAPRVDRGSDWAALVAKGNFDRVVEAAQSRGIDACLASCSTAELFALADAARYTKRSALAESALRSVRQRGGGNGAMAAFLLGRLEESRGRSAAAADFYELYLKEQPRGQHAAEALAGRMRTVGQLRGKAAARPLAEEYLRRFPQGVHAEAAARILGE